MIGWTVQERGMAGGVVRGHRQRAQRRGGEPVGVTGEGVLRETYPHHGERHDLVVFPVLASEWSTRR